MKWVISVKLHDKRVKVTENVLVFLGSMDSTIRWGSLLMQKAVKKYENTGKSSKSMHSICFLKLSNGPNLELLLGRF